MPARLPRATALLVLIASVLISSSPPGRASTTVKGIDVSHWQDGIDWTQVATSDTRFAIVKATEGQVKVDDHFAANVGGASANGIVVGMYHVATPKMSHGAADVSDARAEANHFLDVAHPGAGDLIPALDIELSHVPAGMGPGDLVAWTKAWLLRVTNRLGVHPMIYGSVSLFVDKMGNSPWFASHGYPLWLARWGPLPSPLPAGNWGGQGWTFWQWSNDAKAADLPNIPGITTDVDRDRFARRNLATAEISHLIVHAGAGGSVNDATGRLACAAGTTCDALYDPSAMVTLTADPAPGAVFLSWGGACSGSSPTCVATVLGTRSVTATFGYPVAVATGGPGGGTITSSPAGIACPSTCSAPFPAGAIVTLAAAPDAASEFDSWSGACAGSDPNGCSIVVDQPRGVTARFADLGPPTVVITTPTTLGGAVRFAFSEPVHAVDAANLIVKVAAGSRVDASPVCRDAGSDRVSCAEGPVLSATLPPTHPFVAGQSYTAVANPGAASTSIVDRADLALATTTASFHAATQLTERAPGTNFAWGTRSDDRALGGSYLFERRPGASVSFAFSGPAVTLWTIAGPSFGWARVEIDGAFRTRIDRKASSFASLPKTFTGLGHGAHTLKVITLPGEHPSDPTGAGVDAIADGSGTRRSPASPQGSWAAVAAGAADGGSYAMSGVAGAKASLRFRGTAVTIRTITGPAFGKAQIWVDGTKVAHRDLSAASTTYDVPWTVTGLSDHIHTIRIVVLGLAGASGTGTNVAVDGWTVT